MVFEERRVSRDTRVSQGSTAVERNSVGRVERRLEDNVEKSLGLKGGTLLSGGEVKRPERAGVTEKRVNL